MTRRQPTTKLIGRPTNYPEESTTPYVDIKLIEGVFDSDQKREMIEKGTEAVIEIEGENMRGVTFVVVDEVKSGDWGIGGQAMTAAAVRSLRDGVPA